MSNFQYYIARSLSKMQSADDQEKVFFNLCIVQDRSKDAKVNLKYDVLRDNPVVVERMTKGEEIDYTINVWLMECEEDAPPIREKWLFNENKCDFDNTDGKIIVHIRKLNGETETEESKGDEIHNGMSTEYPAD